MELWIILAILFTPTLIYVAVTAWLVFSDKRELDEFDEYMRERLGEKTETPTVLRNTRRANWK